jgi:predicted peptidase
MRVDRDRVYACGLSMGALEALLLAGSRPDLFAAAFAFNPVVDTRAWQEDLARTANAELRSEGSDRLIAQEVGGSPDEVPEAYAARSAFAVLDGLRTVPVTIWWSHLDLVVPRQAERHGKRLYDELKRLDPTAPVSEYDHSSRYGLPAAPTDDQRWAVHESSDYRRAHWLLLHRARAPPPRHRNRAVGRSPAPETQPESLRTRTLRTSVGSVPSTRRKRAPLGLRRPSLESGVDRVGEIRRV